MDFMSLTNSKRCSGYCGFEGGFLGGIPILDIAVMQAAPQSLWCTIYGGSSLERKVPCPLNNSVLLSGTPQLQLASHL
jgi:hypothetical protein